MKNTIGQERVRNALLRNLAAEDFMSLARRAELVDLPRMLQLAEAGKPAQYAYFPETGIGSIVMRSPEGQSVEVGMFGHDGMSPPVLAAGCTESPMDIFMQVGGRGYRIAAEELGSAMTESLSLRLLLSRYAHVIAVQSASTALSNAVHPVDIRLARWLLMCHDRSEGDELPLTHDFISLMLAVRRPSVTNALHVLEGERLIQSERGFVTVRNREALEIFAADAYGRAEEEYRRLIGNVNQAGA
ncbi:MAG: Crp/Fnr family transcriptional regulator [Flavobacteriaceae bacterium]